MEDVRLPANAMSVTRMITEIATFELIDSETINQMMFYFPETEPYSLNFQECGYDYRNFIQNIGFSFYFIHGIISLCILGILLYLANLLCKSMFLGKIVRIISAFLLWNGLIRIYMELYQDLSLIAALNMHTVDWESPFLWVKVANIYGLIGLIMATSLPILLMIPFYCCKRAKWNNKEFQNTHGAFFQGTKGKEK